MKLFKHTTTEEICAALSLGVFRFYELTKYRRYEDDTGRQDVSEGGYSFLAEELALKPEALPVGSLDGVELFISSFSLGEEYLRQYFVFCLTLLDEVPAISDCVYSVELEDDIFDFLEALFNPNEKAMVENPALSACKLFSHGIVEYYDLNNHPEFDSEEPWREVYWKHFRFAHQAEYRASFFASDYFFEDCLTEPRIYTVMAKLTNEEEPKHLEVQVSAGRDLQGDRYIEVDVSKVSAALGLGTFPHRDLRG